MGSINYGNQILTFDYKQEATAEGFNKINHKLFKAGIYQGGAITKIDDTTVNISPFVCLIEDNSQNNLSVRVETTEIASINVDPLTPYIIIRFAWLNTDDNYADIIAVAEADLLETDLIIGKCLYDGSTLREYFDYTERSFQGKLEVADGIIYEKALDSEIGENHIKIGYYVDANNNSYIYIKKDSWVEIEGIKITYTKDTPNVLFSESNPTTSAIEYKCLIYVNVWENGNISYGLYAPTTLAYSSYWSNLPQWVSGKNYWSTDSNLANIKFVAYNIFKYADYVYFSPDYTNFETVDYKNLKIQKIKAKRNIKKDDIVANTVQSDSSVIQHSFPYSYPFNIIKTTLDVPYFTDYTWRQFLYLNETTILLSRYYYNSTTSSYHTALHLYTISSTYDSITDEGSIYDVDGSIMFIPLDSTRILKINGSDFTVGEISGTTITWGTTTTLTDYSYYLGLNLNSTLYKSQNYSVIFDDSNNLLGVVLAVKYTTGTPNLVYGAISGTSITFGTPSQIYIGNTTTNINVEYLYPKNTSYNSSTPSARGEGWAVRPSVNVVNNLYNTEFYKLSYTVDLSTNVINPTTTNLPYDRYSLRGDNYVFKYIRNIDGGFIAVQKFCSTDNYNENYIRDILSIDNISSLNMNFNIHIDNFDYYEGAIHYVIPQISNNNSLFIYPFTFNYLRLINHHFIGDTNYIIGVIRTIGTSTNYKLGIIDGEILVKRNYINSLGVALTDINEGEEGEVLIGGDIFYKNLLKRYDGQDSIIGGQIFPILDCTYTSVDGWFFNNNNFNSFYIGESLECPKLIINPRIVPFPRPV